MIARLSFWSAAALGWLVLTAVAEAQQQEAQQQESQQQESQQQATSPEELAGNEDVARIMREFAGRGELGDESQPLEPAQSLQRFVVPTDLKLELVAAEPIIAQPIHISFDVRGRMWVVQYRQYPFPAGLKVVRYDQHLRAVFDRVPEPPPLGTPGADRITVFEDHDGDGQYESSRDVIRGLNIATSVAVGAGGIWVTNPPYLLCYPDADGDADPDGDPVVHLSGFGLEDTHSVANSLYFGPDGWLYGVNGSTTTAQIKTHLGNQPTVAYEGQCVWRYHPQRHDFEIYAEGGGNPFGLEIDAAGQIFSGTNWGNTRGMHYPQGGYGIKNWGKHGPLTNQYAFGYLEHMPFSGDGRRFTEEFTIYDDDQLPSRFRGQLLAVNPLQRVVIASHLKRHGSSYATEDFESLITTDDRWFRPVDITLGPDGGLYLADWYDTRLTHVDPRDNWHKSSGRIYRLSANDDAEVAAASDFDDILPSRTHFDLTQLADEALLRLLGHPNRWLRMAALQVLSETRPSAIPALEQLLGDPSGVNQLAALWALTRLQGASFFTQDPHRLAALLDSPHADVRRWTVRLLGDLPSHEQPVATSELVALADRETDAQVRAQLASTARRLSATSGLTLSLAMLSADQQIDRDDPHTKLLLWWALETHCRHDIAAVMDCFAQRQPLWNSTLFRAEILPRLAKRCMLSGRPQDFQFVHQLLLAAADDASRQQLLRGVDQGLAETGISTLPDDLKQTLTRLSGESPHQALVLRLRQGDEEVGGVYENMLSAQAGELAVVGDFDPAMVKEKMTGMLAGWTSEVPYERIDRPAHPNVAASLELIETPDKDNAVLMAMQHFALNDEHPDYPELILGNFVLGGGSLSSRLGTRVRQQDGLSYGVGSRLNASARDERAELMLFAIMNPSNKDRLLTAITEEVENFAKHGMTADELARAKEGYRQQLAVARTDDRQLAGLLVATLFNNRTMDFYVNQDAQVLEANLADVNQVVKQYFNFDGLVISIAGDFAAGN